MVTALSNFLIIVNLVVYAEPDFSTLSDHWRTLSSVVSSGKNLDSCWFDPERGSLGCVIDGWCEL